MKKLVLIIILVMFFLAVVFLIAGVFNKLHDRSLLAKRIYHLPQFSFVSLADESFSSSEITEGPVLIVNFHPECEHCQYELSGLFQSDIAESGIKLILITNALPASVKKFMDSCHPKEMHKFVTLIDTAMIFGDIFGRNYVPSNYLYNKELYLIEALYGEYKTESILKRFKISEQSR